jgi:hypothetical protein
LLTNDYYRRTFPAYLQHTSRASWSCFVMAHSARTTAARGPQSSSSPEPSTHRDGLADPDETSPLLGTNSARALQSSHSERWHFLSAFFDKNAGLSLVAASQFFFSAMNICVKWLNSLDEPIPILEVRLVPEWSFLLADVIPSS